MRVAVFAPETEGNRVTFRWWQSEPNPFQHQNAFFLEYDGINTSAFTTELWLEIFFALISRVLLAYDRPVAVDMPQPIAQQSVDYWLARRGALGRITVTPTHGGGYAPWSVGPQVRNPKRIGLLYGGGKDSLAGLALAHERYGADPLLMIHWFAGFSPGEKHAERVRLRAEELMLRPVAARTGIEVQRIATDYRANLIGRSRSPVKPHLELLVTATLPVVLTRSLETLVITENTWTMCHLERQENGSLRAPGLNLRPESFRLESRHYRRTLGVELHLAYPSRALSASQNVAILIRRYPGLARHMATCIRMESRELFCYDCYKCALIAPVALADGLAPDWYDFDRMFGNVAFWDRALGEDPENRPRDRFGNLVWAPGFVAPPVYAQVCDAFHRIDPAVIRDRLSAASLQRLLQLKGLFGNVAFPYLRGVPAEVAAFNGDAITADIMEIIAREYPLASEPPPGLLSGHDNAVYDFTNRAKPYTADLPHLQDDGA